MQIDSTQTQSTSLPAELLCLLMVPSVFPGLLTFIFLCLFKSQPGRNLR